MDTKLVEKKEVRNLIKSELEQIKGMFIGGDYVFNIYFSDNTNYTNYDYFSKKNIFFEKVKNGICIESIEIDENSTSKKLLDIMFHSTSIIGVSNDQKQDYQNRLIEKISKTEKQMKSIQSTLQKINEIIPLDKRFILILHGIIDWDYELVSAMTGYKRDTIRRKFSVAIDDLAISKGFLMSYYY